MASKIATLALATVAGGAALASSQGPVPQEVNSFPSTTHDTRRQLPIYDPAPQPGLLLPTLSPLQDQVQQTRETVQRYDQLARSHAQLGARKWIGWEGDLERKVKSLVPANEPIIPGFLYVGVATLAGSIVARNRGILLRVVAPPTFFLLSLAYFLPGTTSNLTSLAERFEQERIPEVRAFRGRISALVGSPLSGSGDSQA